MGGFSDFIFPGPNVCVYRFPLTYGTGWAHLGRECVMKRSERRQVHGEFQCLEDEWKWGKPGMAFF